MKKRRIKYYLPVWLLLLAFLGGCKDADNDMVEKEANQVVNIQIVFTVDPTSGNKNNQEVVEAFNREYSDQYYLDVEWLLETEEEYRQNLKRMNVTDKLPAVIYDVCTVPSFYQMMVEENRLVNLAPYLEEDPEWKSRIEPAVLSGCTYEDGSVYLGPISTAVFTCSGMFYNEELFQQAGISEFPTTWDAFWECCDKLKKAGIPPLALHTEGTAWAPMLIATANVAETKEGAEFMRQTLPQSFDTPGGRQLAESLEKMFQYTTEDALHTDYDVAYANFFSGKAAMIPNGYWMIDQIPEEYREKTRFAAFPENTLVASPETFGWAVVNTYSDEVTKGAVEFLKFRTRFNQQEKEAFFIQDFSQKPKVLGDYCKAFQNAVRIVPNYQVKWNSIFQEITLGEALPLLAEGKMTTDGFICMADESIREYNRER